MTIISIALNLMIVLGMAATMWHDLGKDASARKTYFRFFTTDSNVFCAAAALVTAVCEISGKMPGWVFLFKYLGTVSLAVTCLTVCFFLAPTIGAKKMYGGTGIYTHLLGPVFSIVSFCFFDMGGKMSFPVVLTGLIPVILYGAIYYIMVILIGKDKGGWPDFYGFNKGGKWYISIIAMLIGTFAICCALFFLRNII